MQADRDGGPGVQGNLCGPFGTNSCAGTEGNAADWTSWDGGEGAFTVGVKGGEYGVAGLSTTVSKHGVQLSVTVGFGGEASYYAGTTNGPAPNGGRLVFEVCAAVCVDKVVSTTRVERGVGAEADLYPKVHLGAGGSAAVTWTFYVVRW
jgi:hypothetical protein